MTPGHHTLRALTLCLLTANCGRRANDETPPSQSTPTATITSAPVTREAFNALRWLEGRWVGRGETQPPFYEEYKFFDDSTAVSRSFTDSTFRQISDSSVIQWRSGTVESVGNTTRYIVVAIAPDSVAFAPGVGARNGFRWRRISATEWTAVIEPAAGSQRAAVTYTMRKIASPEGAK